MTPHFPHHRRHEELEIEERELSSPAVGRLLAIAIGVTLLLGLVSGTLWIAWKLLRLHVFG